MNELSSCLKEANDTELVRTRYNKNRDLVHLKLRFSKAEEEILRSWK